jgi:hypothetical protein
MRLSLLILTAAAMAVAVTALTVTAHAAGKQLTVGDQAYVSCRHLPVHKEPSALSPIVIMLEFGCPASVVGEVNAASPAGGKKEREPEAVWFKINVDGKEGYVPVRCMVNEKMLRRQDPGRALGKAQQQPQTVAGKGFSETEEGDLTVMKGMGGSAHASGGANYSAIDQVLSQPAQYDPKNAYVEFRKDGALAEFAQK